MQCNRFRKNQHKCTIYYARKTKVKPVRNADLLKASHPDNRENAKTQYAKRFTKTRLKPAKTMLSEQIECETRK